MAEEELNDQAGLADGSIRGESGIIKIREDVIVGIAASAASKVEGLGEKKSTVTEDIRRIFGSRRRGIEIRLNEDKVDISLKIAVKQGYPVHKVARKTQEKIKEEIEENTGLNVNKVDIYVQRLQMPEEEENLEEVLEEPDEEETT